ncbi:MAG: hypothetical protein H6711_16960 [Myxococcales bacterium]|nr:hypothetical protein [Myxococcales bacterium]
MIGLSVAAAIFYGSWAYFANHEVSRAAGARAAVVQGAYSALSTFALSLLMERLFRAGRSPGSGFAIAGGGGIAVMVTTLLIAHTLAGTPRVGLTILPSLVVGGSFCLAYAGGLRALARRQGP